MVDRPLYAVILAGGGASRLSGVDKPMLVVDGRSLLETVRRAASDAEQVVVVGPRRPGLAGVRWTRETPPGGGPVAALAAGFAALSSPVPEADVAVLAGDLPGVRPVTIKRLRAVVAEGGVDGAVLVDDAGRRQWLTGVWRWAAIGAALPEDPRGAAVRATLGGQRVAEVPATEGEDVDVDTLEDLARVRRS